MRKYLAVYGKPRYLGLVSYDGDIKKGDKLLVESARGEESALVVGELSSRQEAEYRQMKHASEHGDGVIKNSDPVVSDLKFLEFATEEDCDKEREYREEEKTILASAKKLLIPHNLDMKLIDVELLRAKQKLFFYFSSEQRVDFRAYVRDLAREFKTRIELRQVGVRDEAKIIRGVGPCGRPCCCSYWLNQFSPIGIKMVKEQNLALNPSKISGICGRLMCCMCFEHSVYHEAWEGLPHPGTKIKTPSGSVIVSGIDLPTSSLKCFIAGKGEVKIPKEKFNEFREVLTSGGEWESQEAESEDEGALFVQESFNVELRSERMPETREVEPRCEDLTAAGSDRDGAQAHSDDHKRGKRRKRHSIRPELQTEQDDADGQNVDPYFASNLPHEENEQKRGDRRHHITRRKRHPMPKKRSAE